MPDAPLSRPRGRPRSFDEAKVLDRVIARFSQAGFAGTAIGDLTETTGLTVGSLYKAYDSKEGLFDQALQRYVSLRDAHIRDTLGTAESGRARIALLLGIYASLSQGRTGRQGCMVVTGVAEIDQVGSAGHRLRATLAARRALLAQLVAAGQQDGSIATKSDPDQVADVLLTVLQGMRVVGKAALFPKATETFVALAMKVLD